MHSMCTSRYVTKMKSANFASYVKQILLQSWSEVLGYFTFTNIESFSVPPPLHPHRNFVVDGGGGVGLGRWNNDFPFQNNTSPVGIL